MPGFITINAAPAPNLDYPLDGSTVTLGYSTVQSAYNWTLLSVPRGSAAALTGPATASPTFSPDVEGTYLVRLVANPGTNTQFQATTVVAVRHLKTRLRIPAAGETTEASGPSGWADDASAAPAGVDGALALVDASLAAFGGLLAAVDTAGGLQRGMVVKFLGRYTLKAGFPGQEYVPGIVACPASDAVGCLGRLGIIEGTPAGGAGPYGANTLVQVRVLGRVATADMAGAPSPGDPVYVSNAALPSLLPSGRRVGTVLYAGGGSYETLFDAPAGAGGAAGLTVTTADATPTAAGTLPVPPNGCLRVRAEVKGVKDDGTDVYGATVCATLLNPGGGGAALAGGASTVLAEHFTDNTWGGARLDVSGGNGVPTVTGKAATTIHWSWNITLL